MIIANKLRYLKYNYRHAFAHKPLCDRFKGETLSFFQIHVCRSCLFLYLGLFLSLFIYLPNAFYLSLLIIVISMSISRGYKKLFRWKRDLLRFSLGFLVGITFFKIINLDLLGFLSLVLLCSAYGMYYKKRKIRKLQDCNGCAELDNGKVCSGFELQAKDLTHYEDILSEIAYKKKGFIHEYKKG